MHVQRLGFSAFDLMFCGNIKGMLQLMKESWLYEDVLNEDSGTNLIDFVLNLREKIRLSMELANDNTFVAKLKNKIWYD